MLSYTDIKKGVIFIFEGDPYEVIDSHFLRMQQRKAVMQTKLRNLISGKVLDRNFQSSETFEEAEVEKSRQFLFTKAKIFFGSTKKEIPKTVFRLRQKRSEKPVNF